MSIMNIGQFLTIKREAMKWSRQQVADSIGCTYQRIYQWEMGKILPKERDLKSICKHYGFSIKELRDMFEDYQHIENEETIQEAIQEAIPEIQPIVALEVAPIFPLDKLKERLEVAIDVCGTLSSGAGYAYENVLKWVEELNG